MTGAVNYEQFVQLLNWRDHPLPQEGRRKVRDMLKRQTNCLMVQRFN